MASEALERFVLERTPKRERRRAEFANRGRTTAPLFAGAGDLPGQQYLPGVPEVRSHAPEEPIEVAEEGTETVRSRLRAENPGALLLFRTQPAVGEVGGWWSAFDADADRLAGVTALRPAGHGTERTCGFPGLLLADHLGTLVRSGIRVVLVESREGGRCGS